VALTPLNAMSPRILINMRMRVPQGVSVDELPLRLVNASGGSGIHPNTDKQLRAITPIYSVFQLAAIFKRDAGD
jgi:hypothetical protein